jgi:hypothetical protein
LIDPAPQRGRRLVTALIVLLLGTAVAFRLMYLSTMPGVSGDEGWWGLNAIAWLDGRPYDTHTTSGNPTDLFLLIPVALVQAIGGPSFALLRAVPAAVNLLALPIAFWFTRRLFGSATAWIHTIALAIAPTAMAHSRLTQDPSQSIFWTAIVIYLALLGLADRRRAWLWLGLALLVFPIALWTHPTNVFIAPFLALPPAAVLAPLIPASRRGRAIVAVAVLGGAIAALAIAWIVLGRVTASNEYLDKPWLAVVTARAASPRQWLEFGVNYARLFNGVTIYHYFSGARPVTWPFDGGFVVIAFVAASGLAASIRRGDTTRRALDCGLVAASAVMCLLFFAFAGPTALRPHAERWGLCLIVPGALVLARGVAGWIETMPRLRLAAIGASSLVAAAVLAGFYVNFFREFATTGGRGHLTYVTAPIEPKQQAFGQILNRAAGSDRIVIVSQQWWIWRPIAYLAARDARVAVSDRLDFGEASGRALPGRRLFLVEFAGSPELASALEWIRARGLRATSSVIQDAGGRALLVVVEVTG